MSKNLASQQTLVEMAKFWTEAEDRDIPDAYIPDENHADFVKGLSALAKTDPVTAVKMTFALDRFMHNYDLAEEVVAPHALAIPDSDLATLRQAVAYATGYAISMMRALYSETAAGKRSDKLFVQRIAGLFEKLSRINKTQAKEVQALADHFHTSYMRYGDTAGLIKEPEIEMIAAIMPYTSVARVMPLRPEKAAVTGKAGADASMVDGPP